MTNVLQRKRKDGESVSITCVDSVGMQARMTRAKGVGKPRGASLIAFWGTRKSHTVYPTLDARSATSCHVRRTLPVNVLT